MRDGAIQFVAPATDRRRLRHLRRVRDRLARTPPDGRPKGPALDVFGPADHLDGGVYVWVQPTAARHAGVWGYPMIAAVQVALYQD